MILVLDREETAAYQALVSALRQAGIRSELYLGASGMKAQMKYADRRGSPCVVIQGSDERAKGEVQIKDQIEGARVPPRPSPATPSGRLPGRPSSRCRWTRWSPGCARCWRGITGVRGWFRRGHIRRYPLTPALRAP